MVSKNCLYQFKLYQNLNNDVHILLIPYSFLSTRYAKKCLIPAQRFFDNLVPLSERTMAFYDLSIPFYDGQNNDKNLHFSSNNGHHGDSLHKIKRYAMPMIIKNSDSNKVS